MGQRRHRRSTGRGPHMSVHHGSQSHTPWLCRKGNCDQGKCYTWLHNPLNNWHLWKAGNMTVIFQVMETPCFLSLNQFIVPKCLEQFFTFQKVGYFCWWIWLLEADIMSSCFITTPLFLSLPPSLPYFPPSFLCAFVSSFFFFLLFSRGVLTI